MNKVSTNSAVASTHIQSTAGTERVRRVRARERDRERAKHFSFNKANYNLLNAIKTDNIIHAECCSEHTKNT